MRELTIPVHPLTRRVLLCEYGAEPFIFPNHDFAFRLLTANPIRDRAIRHGQKLTSGVRVQLDDALARRVEQNLRAISLGFLSFHFQMLCRHADSALQIKGRGHVKAAIENWLYLHKVDENEYAADTAYKLWQRHSWNLQKKNPHFLGQSRGKSERIMSKKRTAYANRPEQLDIMCLRLPEAQIELACARFVASLKLCFRRAPKKINEHARIYYYMNVGGHSCRDITARLGVAKSTANYARLSIERRALQNPTFKKLLLEALPLALPRGD